MQQQVAPRESMDDVFLVDDDDRNSQADKYLLFNIGEEAYGIAISHVTEIIEIQNVTGVPDMPNFVKGVINLRGKVVPVIDLRLRFGMNEREYDDRTCIIVVKIDNKSLGLIVDTVAEVHNIAEDDIDPVPDFGNEEEKGRYISGLGKIGDKVTILIDTEKILKVEQIESVSWQARRADESKNEETKNTVQEEQK